MQNGERKSKQHFTSFQENKVPDPYNLLVCNIIWEEACEPLEGYQSYIKTDIVEMASKVRNLLH